MLLNGMSPTDTSSHHKHRCDDCRFCQWCSDDRCRRCLSPGDGVRQRSLAEQVALFEALRLERLKREVDTDT